MQFSHQLYAQHAVSAPPINSLQPQQLGSGGSSSTGAPFIYSSAPPSLYNAAPFLGSSSNGSSIATSPYRAPPQTQYAPLPPYSSIPIPPTTLAAAGPLSPGRGSSGLLPTFVFPRGASRPESQRWTVTLPQTPPPPARRRVDGIFCNL